MPKRSRGVKSIATDRMTLCNRSMGWEDGLVEVGGEGAQKGIVQSWPPGYSDNPRYAHLAPGHLRDAVNRGSLAGTVTKTNQEGNGEGRCNLLIPWCARRDLNPQPPDP